MAKENNNKIHVNVNISDPDNESTGSNGDSPVTSPSTSDQCSNGRKLNKPQQGPKPPTLASPPLSTNPNGSNARVLHSTPPPSSNRTITPMIRMTPEQAALWFNCGVSTVPPLAPQPAALLFNRAARSGENLYHRYHPYLRTTAPRQPTETVDLLSRMEVRGSAHLGQIMDQQTLRTYDYLAQVHNQPWRAIDFLWQMEAARPAPVQIPRANPPIETLAEWGASLGIGFRRWRKVDLNLKLA